VLNLTRTQREQLFDQLTKSICQAAGALLVGDIGLDVVSGTGFIAVEIGGAEATTGELTLGNPFGDGGGAPTESVLPGLPVPAAIPSYLPTPAPPSSPAAPRPAASIGPLKDVCTSAHPKHHTACSKGDAVAVGLIGLAATLGMAGADWRHQRRRRAKRAAAAGAPA
jgi:hypothetical protein